jgi:hypothetical protein
MQLFWLYANQGSQGLARMVRYKPSTYRNYGQDLTCLVLHVLDGNPD